MARIAVVLTQGFADWEYALIGGTGGPFYGLDVQFFSPEAAQLQSQWGMTATVSKGLDELSGWQPDVVVVVGGTIWATDWAPDIDRVLKIQHENGAHIAGICGGTLALARAGMLDDIPHTSYDAGFLKQNAIHYGGAAHFLTSASAVSSGRVIPAPGTAPTRFTAAVFEAAGLPKETVEQFKGMMAAEHG